MKVRKMHVERWWQAKYRSRRVRHSVGGIEWVFHCEERTLFVANSLLAGGGTFDQVWYARSDKRYRVPGVREIVPTLLLTAINGQWTAWLPNKNPLALQVRTVRDAALAAMALYDMNELGGKA